ncbi:hypothetical protein [Okeania sp. SIO2B9]|nr:hypothetical protein [Okeania sp. SIO2B9]
MTITGKLAADTKSALAKPQIGQIKAIKLFSIKYVVCSKRIWYEF